LSLKLLGFTFQRIATQVTEVGQGRQRPVTQFPPGLIIPPNYGINAVACFRVLNRALEREPQLLVHRLRQLVNHRSEMNWPPEVFRDISARVRPSKDAVILMFAVDRDVDLNAPGRSA
jgi:hypothetical protein